MAQLRRFYSRVTDATNAAVTSPTVSLLRVGAAVVRDATSGATVVACRHPGALKAADICYVIRNGAQLSGITLVLLDAAWTYNSVEGDWEMEVGVVGGSYTPTPGDRLVLTGLAAGHKVAVYDNDTGAGSAGDPVVGSDGTVSGYVDAVDVDVKITSSGTDTFILDVETDGRRAEVAGDVTTQSTGTVTLWSDTIPANWVRFGNGVRLVAWGRCTGSAGVKNIRLDFGTTVVCTVQVATTNDWRIEALILGARTFGEQRYTVKGYDGTTAEGWDMAGTATETATAAIELRVEGEVADAADSLVLDGVIYEQLEA